MNDLDLLWELAHDTPLPGLAELGPARAKLAAVITAGPAVAPSATAATVPGQPPGHRPRPRRRLTLIAAAAAAAAITAVLVTSGGKPTSNARIGGAAAAATVLHRAALAVLRLQAGAPRPDQFIYTKIENGNGTLYQSWLSADGSRTGLIRGAGGVLASVTSPAAAPAVNSGSRHRPPKVARRAGGRVCRSPPSSPACQPAPAHCALT